MTDEVLKNLTPPKNIQIGQWATRCCHRDLYEIQNQSQIEQIIEDWDEGISHDVYLSKREALLYIKSCWGDSTERAYIDKMLTEGL